jgi:hypothetical protein
MTKQRKPGTVAPNRIPIISRTGDVVGNVGGKATQATVARFLGHHGARLGTFKGRRSWIETGVNTRPRPVRRPSADFMHSKGSGRS